MQGGILGIQAKEENKNHTQPTNKKPAIKGGKQKRGAAKAPHTPHHERHRRREERSQEAAEDRGRTTHTHKKGYERALAVSKKGPRIIQ